MWQPTPIPLISKLGADVRHAEKARPRRFFLFCFVMYFRWKTFFLQFSTTVPTNRTRGYSCETKPDLQKKEDFCYRKMQKSISNGISVASIPFFLSLKKVVVTTFFLCKMSSKFSFYKVFSHPISLYSDDFHFFDDNFSFFLSAFGG